MTTINYDMRPRSTDEIRIVCCKPRWISVKKKLPEDQQHVIAANINKKSRALAWFTGQQDKSGYVFMHLDMRHQIIDVTHWMELPECP